MQARLVALLIMGLTNLFHLAAFGAEIGPLPFHELSAKDLAEMKAHLEVQKTAKEVLKTYRYQECVEGDVIRKGADAYSRGVSPSFSNAIETELKKEDWTATMGTAAALKLFAYDLGTKKGALADGAGLGTPIRFYSGNIHAVKDKCRPKSYRMNSIESDPLVGTVGDHLFSITPAIFVSKTANANDNDITIQPALVLSFWHDILHFGAGFNLSGQNQGNAFLLFGIGTQLPGETK